MQQLIESSNDESSDAEEDDRTTCKIHKISWIELTEKCRNWFQYQNAMTREIFLQTMIFFVAFASNHKY